MKFLKTTDGYSVKFKGVTAYLDGERLGRKKHWTVYIGTKVFRAVSLNHAKGIVKEELNKI